MYKIKTAVIGVGSMGQNHARIYNELSDLRYVIDSNYEQAKSIGTSLSVEYGDDYNNILDKVDAVSICVPTNLHRETAETFLRAGIDVLVEKPIAENIEDAKKIIETAKKNSRKLLVGHIERYNPAVIELQKLIRKKSAGDIICLSSKRFSNYPDRIRDVGVISDLGIHDIDVILSTVAESVESVYAVGGQIKNPRFEDYAAITIKFKSGKIGIIETNWLTPMKVREISVTTTTNYINLNYMDQSLSVSSSEFGVIDKSNLYNIPLEKDTQSIKITNDEPLKLEIDDFLSTVADGSKENVTGEAGLAALQIVTAAKRSIKTGKIVYI